MRPGYLFGLVVSTGHIFDSVTLKFIKYQHQPVWLKSHFFPPLYAPYAHWLRSAIDVPP